LRSGRNYSENFCNRILTMASFLRAITPAGGVPPQIGDADDGFLTRFDISWPENAFRDVLAAVDVIFENRAIAWPLPQKAFWYALCLGKTPQVSEQISEKGKSYPAFFQKGGYAILGKEALHLLFDAGQLGYPAIAAHGHADALNVCLALDGEWWLVDPGTYAYHSEHGWRDYFRGTAAHNTIRVNNLDQSQIGGPFLWLRHAQARLVGAGVKKNGNQWAVGEHDGYKKIGGVHVRRVELDDVGNRVSVFDEVRGSVEHELGIYFHFAPEIEVVPGDQRGTWLATKSGTARRMLMVVDESWCWKIVRGSVSPKLGWYSSALGIKVPTCTLFGIWRGRLPVKVVTRMIVY